MDRPLIDRLLRPAPIRNPDRARKYEPDSSLSIDRRPARRNRGGWVLNDRPEAADVQQLSPAFGRPPVYSRLVRCGEAADPSLELRDALTHEVILRLASEDVAALSSQLVAYNRHAGQPMRPVHGGNRNA